MNHQSPRYTRLSLETIERLVEHGGFQSALAMLHRTHRPLVRCGQCGQPKSLTASGDDYCMDCNAKHQARRQRT